MDSLRIMIEIPGDQEAVRRLLLRLAPRMEAKQPGITQQLTIADLSQPLQMLTPSGEVVSVRIEERGDRSALKVQVQPPRGEFGRWRAAWWRWRTRMIVRWTLKGVRKAIARDVAAS